MPAATIAFKRIADYLQANQPENDITIRGWVRTRREGKDVSFLEINDGSQLKNLQVVLEGKLQQNPLLKQAQTGAAVKLSGDLTISPGREQGWELKARRLEIIGLAEGGDYPLQKKRHTDEFLRTMAHLRARTNKYGAIFRLRGQMAHAVHDFFRPLGFHYVHTPIITGSDCEGAGEMFQVTTLNPAEPMDGDGRKPEDDFFGKFAALTVSGQLEAECLALALGRVYTFGPTFRAENSNTPRHAAEFWMIEPEAAFFDLADNMDLAEHFVKYLTREALSKGRDDLALFNQFVEPGLLDRLETLATADYERISYREALNILEKSGRKFEFPIHYGADLQTEHERHLCETYFKKPVFVHDYPRGLKPFYMRLSEDGQTVAAMDLLVPKVGELIGGSQREERLPILEARLQEMGLAKEDYWWYLDLRRWGSVPHSGFGLGFERFMMLLTGVTNIRDVIPFPRTPKNLEF